MGLFSKSFEVHDDDLLAIVKSFLKEAEPRETVFLISPYWQMNANLRSALKDAVTDGVRVKCIMRANEKLSPEDTKFFAENRIEIRGLAHLHAKLYLAEEVALISSMNLYSYSDKESLELGVVVQDSKEVSYLKELASKWWDEAKSVDLNQKAERSERTGTRSNTGHCIRCGTSKSYNSNYPHCDSCYTKWAEYKNDTYPEKYCHKCGKQAKTTKRDPICSTCQR